MILVDGSAGEGGGQVLRTALTLATLTGTAVRVEEIRAGRSQPGLRPQHLAAVQAAASICDARVLGADLDSRTVTFIPGGAARPGTYVFDVAEIAGRGSAGAVGLVLQTVLLPLAFADGPSDLILRGGTHVSWAPSVDYLQEVYLPTVAKMGLRATVELVRWGFYPVGGGEVRVQVEGGAGSLRPLHLTERGPLQRAWGHGVACSLPAHIAQRMANRARNLLEAAGVKAHVEARRVQGAGPGAAVFLFAAYEQAVAGFCAYGRKGLASEHVAAAACDELLAHHRCGAPVDPHLADQLVLPMVLAAGVSRVATSSITGHLLTNLALVQSFLPARVLVEGEKGEPGAMSVTGIVHD